MRISFILPLPDMSGGIKVVAIYAKALVQMGHVVHLFSPSPQSIPLHRKVKLWLTEEGLATQFAPSAVASRLQRDRTSRT